MHACFTEFVSASFRTRNIHTPFRPFIYVRLLISVCLSLHLCECLRAPFLEREIFIHFIRLFMFVLAAWVFGSFVMFVGVVFKTRNIHIPFHLFIVMVRHEPSWIVAIRTNVATRLGSSRSANFFRARRTLPEVHFRSPFSRHDFRCDGQDSR